MVELGLSELISFCKKWYIRDELCGLTKKKEKKLATVIVGLFSLKENAPTKKLPTVIVGLFSLREKAPTKNTLFRVEFVHNALHTNWSYSSQQANKASKHFVYKEVNWFEHSFMEFSSIEKNGYKEMYNAVRAF